MLPSTTHTQKEQLNTQLGTENTHNKNSGEELLEREQIKGSPMWIIGNAYQGYALFMGKHRISEVYENVKEIKEYLEEHKWDVITKIALCIVNDIVEMNNKSQLEEWESIKNTELQINKTQLENTITQQ